MNNLYQPCDKCGDIIRCDIVCVCDLCGGEFCDKCYPLYSGGDCPDCGKLEFVIDDGKPKNK